MHKFSTKLPTRVVTWIHKIAASSQSPQQTLTCKVVWLITGYLQSTEHYRVLSCIPATCIIRHVLRFQNRFLGRILHGNWYIHSWKVSVLDQSPGPENPVEGSDQMWRLFFKLSSAGAVKRLGLLERASTSEGHNLSFSKKVQWLSLRKGHDGAPTCSTHRTFDCDRIWPGTKRRINLPLSELIGQSHQESIVFVTVIVMGRLCMRMGRGTPRAHYI